MSVQQVSTRFIVEKHTNHSSFGFRVYDLWTDETHGYGLLAHDAVALAIELDRDSLT